MSAKRVVIAFVLAGLVSFIVLGLVVAAAIYVSLIPVRIVARRARKAREREDILLALDRARVQP